jgi:hypothetical protein
MPKYVSQVADRFYQILGSSVFFYVTVTLFVLGAAWIALSSIYPMAFDEEFHYGLIKIYAGSVLPYGIEHTSDMAQYGAATADASYLFHYLMSFPYRVLDFVGLSDTAIIIVLRILNIAFVAGALVLLRKALLAANMSRTVTHTALLLVTLIPIFPLLAAHINYDNLLLLVFAWCLLSMIKITHFVRSGKAFPLTYVFQLAVAVLIGMSIKYAFLPLALGLFVWLVWLLIVSYRKHRQTITTQVAGFRVEWKRLSPRIRWLMVAMSVLSIFFASHYLTNTLSYGSPIPSCERVFSESECTAYGPWNRNKSMEARKSETFEPMPYAEYMTTEWVPGMTQRLTFAVAGKTNDFDTKLPLPVLVYTLLILTTIGVVCLAVQTVRKRTSWFAAFTILLTMVYAGVLSFQLYGDYVDTAEPVAINGRYLLPLLPLVAVMLIQAMRGVLRLVNGKYLMVAVIPILILLIVGGAGIGTYVVQAGAHWFWLGFGQDSHAFLRSIFESFVLPYRY